MICRIFLQALVVVLTLGSVAEAKDMASRLGIGFRNAFPFSMAAIAMHYHPGPELGLFGAVGVDTQEYNSKFGLQLGIRKIVFKEDHLNFFMGGSFSTLTQEVQSVTVANSSTKTSGYELAAIVGAEFFFTGLENLGFNMETGIAVVSMDKVRFRTVGDDFLRAGITFYF